MKITTIDRAQCKALRDRLDAMLRDANLGDGLTCAIKGAASFTDKNVTFKVEVAIVGSNGIAETREASTFRAAASLYGLKADDLGRIFRCSGREYTIAGLKPRASKDPILARRSDGKMFKFPADVVARLIAA